jgi:hypothetical protein
MILGLTERPIPWLQLYRGEYTPEQAHEAAVKGVQDLIIEYLST